MKLVTFRSQEGASRLGAMVSDTHILDLALADGTGVGPFGSMMALIAAGEAGLDQARALTAAAPESAIVAMEDVRLQAPLPVPARLRDAAMFIEHLEIIAKAMAQMAAEQGAGSGAAPAPFDLPEVLYRRACYYNGNHHAVLGPDEPLRWPSRVAVVDYELELAVVVGRAGSDLSPEEARSHIFGYTLMNDWSARDLQMDVKPSGAGPCMGKDFGTSLGPCIVTADEIGDPQALELEAFVDGELWSRGSTRNMHHSFAEAVSQFSWISPLVPGEVIGSGTPAHGSASEQGKRLEPGQVVELRNAVIGALRTPIQA